MTRGLAEMARLGAAMGAKAETFAGLSGMGDLIVTCGSMHSSNRRAGDPDRPGDKPRRSRPPGGDGGGVSRRRCRLEAGPP